MALRRSRIDLAEKLWTVRDLRELPEGVRGEALDVLGHEAAQRGCDRDGNPNALGDELNALAAALLDDDTLATSLPSSRDAYSAAERVGAESL